MQHNGSATPITLAPSEAGRLTPTNCPECHAEFENPTKYEPGFFLCCFGTLIAVFGCCFQHCCVPRCWETYYTCPQCKAYLGSTRK